MNPAHQVPDLVSLWAAVRHPWLAGVLAAMLLRGLHRRVPHRPARHAWRLIAACIAISGIASATPHLTSTPPDHPTHHQLCPSLALRSTSKHERKPGMYFAHSTQTLLAATDLVSGSRSLYTIGVGVLVIFILLAGGARAAAAFLGGRIGQTVSWALTAVIVAVIVGSGYAIYVSSKRTVDRTGITTGQFGQ
jgi:hypothetical protein